MAKIYFFILIFFLISSCSDTKQIIKESQNKESESLGYLKLNIIDAVNDDIFSRSTVELRGVKKLPVFDNKYKPFEKDNDFEIRGAIKENTNSMLALEEGDYYVYLHVNDSVIRPLLISDFTSKTVQFGYRPTMDDKIFDKQNELIPYTNKACHFPKSQGEPIQCAVLKIERNKITEITLKFQNESNFNPAMTSVIWLFTILTPIPHVGAPLIILGSIIVTRDVELQTILK
jgi:hypothetical protein